MGWILRERRGPEWKQSWTERTLASTFEIPMPLLVLFAVTVLLVFASYYFDYKSKMEQTMLNLQLSLFVVAVVAILSMHLATVFQEPRSVYNSERRWDGSPWGVAAVVLLLVVLVSYQSSIQSKWFKLL